MTKALNLVRERVVEFSSITRTASSVTFTDLLSISKFSPKLPFLGPVTPFPCEKHTKEWKGINWYETKGNSYQISSTGMLSLHNCSANSTGCLQHSILLQLQDSEQVKIRVGRNIFDKVSLCQSWNTWERNFLILYSLLITDLHWLERVPGSSPWFTAESRNLKQDLPQLSQCSIQQAIEHESCSLWSEVSREPWTQNTFLTRKPHVSIWKQTFQHNSIFHENIQKVLVLC